MTTQPELVGCLPSSVWKKIANADKIGDLYDALRVHNPVYKFDVVEFCVVNEIKLSPTDFQKIRIGAKRVKKPVKLRVVPEKSKFFAQIGSKAWGSSHVVMKSTTKPPRLAAVSDRQEFNVVAATKKLFKNPASKYSGSQSTEDGGRVP